MLSVSDSVPIQFWPTGEETFNEKEVCGLVKQDCFCQILNCDDVVRIQITDDTGRGYELAVYDETDAEISRNEFIEYGDGVYDVSFTLDNSPCDQKVKFVIEQSESVGTRWVTNNTAPDAFTSIVYGEDMFVAVSTSALGVWSSVNGIDWIVRTNPVPSQAWRSVTYGNGLFVAVGDDSGTGDQVMTSPDGVTWTKRTAASTNSWQAVTYGEGLFVAVSNSGAGNRVMTSPDGITWTSRTSAANNSWLGIAYGNGIFVAVGASGSGNRAMWSANGTTGWTAGASAADKSWTGIAFGNGVFVAVAQDDGIMTSVDGAAWVSRTTPVGSSVLVGITFGNGLFVAVGNSPSNVATSPNGITWYNRTSSPSTDGEWNAVAYGDGRFVAVGFDGGLSYFSMYSLRTSVEVATSDCIDVRDSHTCSILIEYENTSNFDGINYEAGSPGPSFQLRIPAVFYEEENPQEQEDLELSNGVIVNLRQSILEKRELETGYMPNYMHLKLQKVLMHESVQIDGDYWKRRDAYETKPIKKYNLKTASVLLTKYDSVEKNTI